ncbi:MAG: phosphatase PAP2 family protein [Lachnospiraceae bacterium]|nr:phosphatase PAP2 family protein [Lachnospiraceae bacterium]
MEWEVRLIEWMQGSFGDLSRTAGKIFAFIGGEAGLLIMMLIVMFCWKKEVGKRLALILAAENAYLSMIKTVVMRPRPYMEHPDRVEALVPVKSGADVKDVAAQGYSFPSMHSASVTAAYMSLAYKAKKRWVWILAVCLTFLVGVSRPAVGAHYPTDVLAGWALGFAVIGIFSLLDRFVKKEWICHLILLAMALPGVFFVRTQDYFASLGLLIGVIAAIPFEEKYVGFKDTGNVFAMILRVIGAVVIFLLMNTLLKMPFNSEFLASARPDALLIRTARYAVMVFVVMGVYPKVFPLFEKIKKS